MEWKKILFSAVLAALLAGNGVSQVAAPPTPGTSRGPSNNPRRARPEPCWTVAGISKATMQQRRSIMLQARQQMQSVCMNSSLAAQQKAAEIRQIREHERVELENAITPAQREAMRACQAQRGHHGGGVGHAGGHGIGPCGELSAHPHAFAEDEEDEAPPAEEHKPN
jgi:hypothetical protein